MDKRQALAYQKNMLQMCYEEELQAQTDAKVMAKNVKTTH